ncbi:MAG: 6-bladed beta-propeller, partial [Gemmatimonadetes bacterium]|nr:6-bladed beta-propeller [Gemmatimonadota bacterium]
MIAVACLITLTPASILAANGAHGSPPQEVVVDTVTGRPVMTNQFPQRGGNAGAWRLVEELRLGNVMGDGPEGFGDIQDIAVDPTGRIYVLDVASEEVRVFGGDGAYLRTMAREGEGPGEFRYSSNNRITWRAPGQLWIGNSSLLTVVDTLGNELRRHAWRRPGRGWMPGEVPISRRVIAAGTDGSVFSVV